MARVNIDDDVWTDDRFTALGRLLGGSRLPGHMQHALGVGVAAKIWRKLISLGGGVVSKTALVDLTFSAKICQALIGSGLAEDLGDGTVRIRGATSQRIGYLQELKNGAKVGGETRAAGAARDASGRFQPAGPAETSGPVPGQPSAPAPAPAPALDHHHQAQPPTTQQAAIENTAAFEKLCESNGWCLGANLTGKHRAKVHRLAPIAPHEIEPALARVERQKATGGFAVGCFLQAIEFGRRDAEKERSGPASKATASPEEPIPRYQRVVQFDEAGRVL